ncbi:MAG: hypothetical protein BGO01_09445 [Armatimonadetes bacterium 55-13]|nr:rhomboid family intramembrane serine protease [Armatimonadota bacterium]OJU62633.1 MAG: hypothetical protein BGO01_09445 [Armatimonadetes bacterium 55-13]
MLLPIRSKNPPESIPFVTIILITINIVVYACTSNGFEIKESIVNDWGLKGSNFDFLHMTSSMFLHGSLLHIIGNMWFLYLFGFAVEGRLKSFKFLILYFLAGYAGDLLHQLILGASHPDIPSIGASGAIMGVLGAALYMFPHGKVTFFYWWRLVSMGTFDWPMWGVAGMYLGLDILEAILFGGRDGVGHLAHIGGAVGGLFLCLILRAKRDDEFTSDAKATLSETKDLRILSRMELAQLHRVNPGDTAVLLNWMHKSINDPGGPKPECREAFFKGLPKMLAEQEIGPIATCIAALNHPIGTIKSGLLMDCATRLERANDNLSAMRMYESILKDPQAAQGDLEAAMFRGGMISEAVYQNFDSAKVAYSEIVRRWPMSPFADQAKVRLKYVESRLTPAQTP